ncbi:MAG TPA: hypothetical protein VFT13_10970 [Candidatus Krumholzibacteria bacterium]|nr:hypothetical protein [Candidatus Krumholzibacteria bacterium]
MTMLAHLLIAAAGIVGLMLAWLAVQSLKRRSDPDGKDVLSCGTCGAHSCGGCALNPADGSPQPGSR